MKPPEALQVTPQQRAEMVRLEMDKQRVYLANSSMTNLSDADVIEEMAYQLAKQTVRAQIAEARFLTWTSGA